MVNQRFRKDQVARRPDVAAQGRVAKAKKKIKKLVAGGSRLNPKGASSFTINEQNQANKVGKSRDSASDIAENIDKMIGG